MRCLNRWLAKVDPIVGLAVCTPIFAVLEDPGLEHEDTLVPKREHHGMSSPVAESLGRFVLPVDDEHQPVDPGVASNSRLTGAFGAIVFVGLFIEGLTILLGVGNSVVLHVFVGFLIVPPVLAKLASTTYRMIRYYLNDTRYRRKGPPPVILRVVGPLVSLSTLAVLGTGIALIAVNRGQRGNLNMLHKLSFLIWLGLMTVHVLGHLVETVRLSAADWAPRRPRTDGLAVRRTLVIGTVALGLGLGALSIGWIHNWQTQSGRGRLGGDAVGAFDPGEGAEAQPVTGSAALPIDDVLLMEA